MFLSKVREEQSIIFNCLNMNMFLVLCQNYPCRSKVGLHLDRLCGRGQHGRLASTGFFCLLFSRFCATTSEMSVLVNVSMMYLYLVWCFQKKQRYPKFWGISIKFPSITWVGCFLFRNLKPWGKPQKKFGFHVSKPRKASQAATHSSP